MSYGGQTRFCCDKQSLRWHQQNARRSRRRKGAGTESYVQLGLNWLEDSIKIYGKILGNEFIKI
jgi:hypothetical protein